MKTIYTFLMLLLSSALTTAGAQAWSLTGNTGTNPATNFIGTTDNKSLSLQLNGSSAGFITVPDNLGNLAFGYGSYIIGSFSRSQNTALGHEAMFKNTYGDSNVAVGYRSLYNITFASYNVAFGYASLFKTTGSYTTALGNRALYNNNSSDNENLAVGYAALYSNTTGYFNLAIGFEAMYRNIYGTVNLAVGYKSLLNNNTGQDNIAIGKNALVNNTSGTSNTAVGSTSLSLNNTFSGNSSLGYNAGIADAIRSNTTAIGNGAQCTNSSQIRFGNSSDASIGGFTNWTNISDGRYKKNIAEKVPGLSFINKLSPVTYTLDVAGINNFLNKNRTIEPDHTDDASAVAAEKIIHSGFIAQQVGKTAKEIGYDFSGIDAPENEDGLYGLRYATFVVPLVKAVQELDGANKEMTEQNSLLIAENNDLKTEGGKQDARMNELEALITRLQSENQSSK